MLSRTAAPATVVSVPYAQVQAARGIALQLGLAAATRPGRFLSWMLGDSPTALRPAGQDRDALHGDASADA